jgi:hypothetical protein
MTNNIRTMITLSIAASSRFGKHRLLWERPIAGHRIIHVSRVLLGPDRVSDPHDDSARRIAANDSSERMQAAEAFREVSVKVRLQNLALAAALTGFVTGVYLYSIQAVGGNIKNGDEQESGALQYLELAAAEGRKLRDEKLRQERHIEGLLNDEDENDDVEQGMDEKEEKRGPLTKKKNLFYFWKRE